VECDKFFVMISLYSSVEITNKMQPCNRIYHSTVHWQLNMFRAAYRSSSGALTVFAASGLHTHLVTGRSQVWVWTEQLTLRLDYGRSPHAYVNQRLQIQLELLMMSGMPLETCWAVNERWNDKFCYKVASCWLFLLSHTTMHGSMNIKFIVFILSKFRSKLLAANHLIIQERTKFDAEQKSSKILLEIMTLVSSASNIGFGKELLSGKSHLCILLTTDTLELILGELHVSLYPSQRKNFELI